MDPARGLKYGLDRVVAAILLIFLAPLLGIIALAIRFDSPGSPIFLQERIGAAGRAFTIFKFRTMREGRESDGLGVSTASDDDRITRIGRWLRATSFDELPQLLNILLGEMSFVGPRPTLRYQVEAYTQRQRRRLLFRPGVTGWAQVHGRNSIPWHRRIELDLEYVDHYSLGLDLRILWRTLAVVGRRDGVYASAGANDAFIIPTPAAALPEPAIDGVAAAPEPFAPVPASTAADVHRATVTPAAPPPASEARSAPPRSDPIRLYATPATAAHLPLFIIGAGGHARVLIDIAEKQGRFHIFGLLDESRRPAGATLMGYPILGGRERLDRRTLPSHAVVAIGSPVHRAAWQKALEEMGFQLAVLQHPSAQVGRDVQIGAGTVLMAQVAVNSGSRIGRGVILNTGASVDHDCVIGDFVHVAPGARLAGGVRVGARTHVGIGSCIIQNIAVGTDAVIGAGAAVVRSVANGLTVGGVPARPLASGAATSQPAASHASPASPVRS